MGIRDLTGKQLPDLFEKRLIVARYFIKQKNKGIKTRENEAYHIWNSFFRGDFQRAKKYKLKWVAGKLVPEGNNISKDLVTDYNRKWQDAYDWIVKYVNKHSLSDCGNDIMELRKKQYKELIRIFKPLQYYVRDTKASVGDSQVASYHITAKKDHYQGSYSKLLEYAEDMDKKIN